MVSDSGMRPSLKRFFEEKSLLIEKILDEHLPREERFPQKIHKAMRYSLFSGGKRLRPLLVLECCRVCGGDEEAAFPAAAAVEYIHTYSLIHDDLPCMDDDDLRRGRPTVHKVFGEAMAVLAGDGLLTAAFGALTSIKDSAVLKRVLSELAKAAGSLGMVGGQTLDITSEQEIPPETPLEEYVFSIHLLKTASLIKASCRIGAMCAYAKGAELSAITAYGRNIGLAFQICDDILDETGSKEETGKKTHKDREKGKITYPLVFGLERSRSEAARLIEEAKESLRIFGEKAEILSSLADFIISRTY
ncbi:MAG: polyprenyl synthetase family protein [Planctomycetota bacterium]|nr:polyprenyl synthetase family protein [Planctomycetota bacterium]